MNKYFSSVILVVLFVVSLSFKTLAQINKTPDFGELEQVITAPAAREGRSGRGGANCQRR